MRTIDLHNEAKSVRSQELRKSAQQLSNMGILRLAMTITDFDSLDEFVQNRWLPQNMQQSLNLRMCGRYGDFPPPIPSDKIMELSATKTQSGELTFFNNVIDNLHPGYVVDQHSALVMPENSFILTLSIRSRY